MQKENTTNKGGNLDQPNVTGLAAKGAAVNVVELFSGIGGFTKGLMDAGMKINKHYYSEIDKHAIANYKHNFPNAEYIGSVTDVRGRDLEQPNIITFGSPCQDFSLAGKRKGMEGQRSSLILHAIRLIRECRPDFFIWENVKGAYSSNDGADFWGIIQAFADIGGYRLEWQLLNTSWFLPQNRERIYLIGHLAGRSFKGIFPIRENDGLFNKQDTAAQRRTQAENSTTIRAGSMRADDTFIEVPKIDVIGNLHGEEGHNVHNVQGLAPTVRQNHGSVTLIKSNTEKGFEEAKEGDSINFSNPSSKTRRGRVGKGKAQTLDAACNQGIICVAQRGRNPENSSDRTTGAHTEQRLEPNSQGTTNTLTSVAKDNLIMIGTLNKTITKRTHETPIEINKYLKQRKGKLTIGHITDLLLLPKTQVEHYFRTDKSRAVPTPEVWDKLKSILKLDDRYDAQIKDVYEKQSEFESTQRVYSDQGASPTITNGGQLNIMTKPTITQNRVQSNEVRSYTDFAPAISSTYGTGGGNIPFVNNIRRLTEIECERLQGFPDNWTEFGNYDGVIKSIPKTQRYKLLGNAVTVNVVKAIGCRLLAAAPLTACR